MYMYMHVSVCVCVCEGVQTFVAVPRAPQLLRGDELVSLVEALALVRAEAGPAHHSRPPPITTLASTQLLLDKLQQQIRSMVTVM